MPHSLTERELPRRIPRGRIGVVFHQAAPETLKGGGRDAGLGVTEIDLVQPRFADHLIPLGAHLGGVIQHRHGDTGQSSQHLLNPEMVISADRDVTTLGTSSGED